MKRKDFLLKTGAACVGISLLPTLSCSNSTEQNSEQGGDFKLPKLGFSYDALAPAIDARTMEIHYTKHHAGYVKKLNAALKKHHFEGKSLDAICTEITSKEADIAVLNNAGGHYNHSLFWEILTPGKSESPEGKLYEKLVADFGNINNFYDTFANAAATVFGSGWAWLIVDSVGKLQVVATQNQENPLMKNIVETHGTPILGLDVWEHAYYLHYQNRRKEYIKNFFPLINWEVVAKKYKMAYNNKNIK